MKFILAVALAALFVSPLRAEDSAAAPKAAAPAKSSWSGFLKNLKETLARSAVSGERKRGRASQGVAAVRGEGQAKKNIADPNEPGLKGDIKSAKAKKEMGYDLELESAIDLLTKGKGEEGLKALEAFKVAHPKHHVEDVDKAIEGAKAMIVETSAAPAAKE